MKCALIGHGMVADTHLAAIADIDALDLAGVLGRDPDQTLEYARKASERLGTSVKTYHSIDEIASDASVDFAIITTPPDARRTYVERLAAAGVPILMEKPIERSLANARDIVGSCDQASVPLGICFQHRARAASATLQSAVASGRLGRIVSVEIRVPWWRDQSYYEVPGRGTYARDGGGVVMTQAIHTLDLALWIAGPAARVLSHLHRTPLHSLEAEDWAAAIIQFQNGAAGVFHATTAAYPGSEETLSIQGTLGHAALMGSELRLNMFDGHCETIGEPAPTGGGADPMGFSHAWHQHIIEDFAACVRDKATPIASGASALQVHALIDAMQRADQTGTWAEVEAP